MAMPVQDEQPVYGFRTCRTVFERRRDDIIRVFYREDRARQIGTILKWAASMRLAYRQLDDAELEKVSRSTHHEGLVMVVKPMRLRMFEASAVPAGRSWVALDEVGNPHNLGAIVRTCAFFGVYGVLAGGMAPGTKVSGAVQRMAEGGADFVALYGCTKLSPALAALKAGGCAVIGFETEAERTLGSKPLRGPAVLLFGHEQEGISPAVKRSCTVLYRIPGVWAGGSLNVSVAVGVALAAAGLGASPGEGQAGGVR
jgi:tRNA G18 (ribose-2'-O)-methylase SpoU